MPESQRPAPAEAPPLRSASEAERLVQFAKSQPLADGGLQTAQLLSRALDLDPHHHEAQILQERLHQTFVPRWHFPMLADAARNAAYARAITAKVRPGDIVLDIGCGAGLTAMLAARAGAKHVYTCEQQPLIAQAARRVIADNGLSDRITVICKWSHDIVVGVDLPEPADVVISEIVDTVLLGEGALATLTHAMSALAKPEARTIPERGRLVAQPVESNALLDLWRPQQAEGFDLSAFHHLARVAQLPPSDFEACALRPLGPTTELFEFDFARPNINRARTTADLTCSDTGTVHAVLASFEMELAPGVTVANDIDSGGHWGRTAFLLDQPTPVQPGDRAKVIAQHDAAQLSLSVREISAPAKEARSPIVWMNPAWVAPAAARQADLPSPLIEAEAVWARADSAVLQPAVQSNP
ncbi:50S ribosomal protein L11 methyltransferase [Pseudophaeobacter sp.]|uniref:50S ribosomal protein L11 methyltransferase n=1 Tax=Pseudophaeobacter sp. TaxID=1971739 RepID=UPI00405A0715